MLPLGPWNCSSRKRQTILQVEALEPRDVPATPVVGAGSGLVADYFADPALANLGKARTDTAVNFDWGTGVPDAALPADGFSVRWTGRLQAQYTEAYTFTVRNDDLAKLWVNGQLLINDTTPGGTADNSVTLNLVAGETYDIRLEYTDVSGAANVQLLWSSPSTPQTVIPVSQLYPTGNWISGGILSAGVGNPPPAGSFTSAGGTYTAAGAGSGLGGTADQFQFGYYTLNGDGAVEAKVNRPTGGAAAEGDLLFRDGLSADARFVSIGLRADGSVVLRSRSGAGGTATETVVSAPGDSIWLRLVRRDDVFTAYTSTTGDPASWVFVGSVRVNMSAVVQAGLGASGGMATFSNVSVSSTVPLGAGIDGLADWSRTIPFADAMKTARNFGTPGTPWDEAATLDTNRQPNTDFGVVVFTNLPDAGGTYHLIFQGQATVSPVASPAVIQNVTYDSATNTTRADLVMPVSSDPQQLMLAFRNTRRTPTSALNTGVTNVRILRPGYAETDVFTRPFLQQASRFDVLRFMDWLSTNNNPVTSWATRTKPTDNTQATTRGVAWEYVAQLANTLHTDPWVNIPANADDDYIRQVATLLRDTLAPDRVVYVEYSNEVWNWGFQQARDNLNAAVAEVQAGITSGIMSPLVLDPATELGRRPDGTFVNDFTFAMRRVADRIKHISDIFASVWGADQINARVRPVLASQVANPSILQMQLDYLQRRYGNPSQYIYAVAGAPYFNLNGGDNPGLTSDQVLSLLSASIADIRSGVAGQALQQYAGLATSYGLQMMAYEGGPDTFGGNNIAAKRAATLDPRMRNLVDDYLAAWYGHGGGQFNWFVTGATDYTTPFGTWGLAENINQQVTPKIQGIDDVLHGPRIAITDGTPLPNTVDARATIGATAPYSNPYLRYVHRGQFVEYLVRAPQAGTYHLTFSASTPGSNEQIQITVNGKVVRTLTLRNTGGYESWGITDAGDLVLQQGLNVIRLTNVQETSGWNMQTLNFTAVAAAPPPPPPVNAPPTVAQAASGSPSPVTGTTTQLHVLGADDGGEANLTYTWSVVGTPPAPVTFSANGTNAAKDTIATFTKAGTYTFQVTISDGNLSATSSVTVVVQQTLTGIAVSPATATVQQGGTQQFTAVGSDQFGSAMATPPALAWSLSGATAPGTMTGSGLYTAPTAGTPTVTVRATAGAVSGSASVTVTPTVQFGTGNGLRGKYYDNYNFTNLKVTRTDPTLNFNWVHGSPDPSIGPETFSVRWQGQLQAVEAGTYYLQTNSDDGVRVWVSSQLVINDFFDHAATLDRSTPIVLAAGQKVSIRIDYRENTDLALLQLMWQRPGQTSFTIVPQSQLYSPANTGPVYQAESAVLSGAMVRTDVAGYSGTGFVSFTGGAGSYVDWTINTTQAGNYTLRFRYSNSAGTQRLALARNGTQIWSGLAFETTQQSSWWDEMEVLLYLPAGANHIRLSTTQSATSALALDYLMVV
jgi:PA14 domain/Carbohydrate binding module (family 35)/Carbohydrate binding module (family 6)/K319L-like, PKD domain